jgi:serine kinase of HPr protein (carbohydrate metabolism regulator)
MLHGCPSGLARFAMIAAPKQVYVHATAIAISGHGILITGRSKAGKSTLAERLMAEAQAGGLEALLIGDDRVGLSIVNQEIRLSPHPAIAGLIERRGTGIVPVPSCAWAVAVFEIALIEGAVLAPARFEPLPGHSIPGLVIGPRPDASALFPLVLAALPQ